MSAWQYFLYVGGIIGYFQMNVNNEFLFRIGSASMVTSEGKDCRCGRDFLRSCKTLNRADIAFIKTSQGVSAPCFKIQKLPYDPECVKERFFFAQFQYPPLT